MSAGRDVDGLEADIAFANAAREVLHRAERIGGAAGLQDQADAGPAGAQRVEEHRSLRLRDVARARRPSMAPMNGSELSAAQHCPDAGHSRRLPRATKQPPVPVLPFRVSLGNEQDLRRDTLPGISTRMESCWTRPVR